MDLSIFLAKVMGIYFIIVSLAFLLNKKKLIEAIPELMENYALRLVLYIFTLILGILLIVSHNIWELNWTVVITIIAWLVFIKGALNLLFPHFLNKLAEPWLRSEPLIISSIILNLLIGIFLFYYGYFAPIYTT